MIKKVEKGNEPKNEISIGVAIPMSDSPDCTAEHWTEVFDIIKSAFDEDERYTVKIVSKSNEMAVIQDAIVNNLYHNDVVICDVSCGNPNVMFELGMRLAFDKPTIVIKDLETPYTFDTAPIRHIEYPRGLHYQSILDFKYQLKSAVDDIISPSGKDSEKRTFLSNFGNLTAAKVQDKEIPEGQYIIKKLDSLMNKVERLELKDKLIKNDSISSNPRSFSFTMADPNFKEIVLMIDKVITEVARRHDYVLPDDINKVPLDILDIMRRNSQSRLAKELGVTLSDSAFNKAFKEAYSFAHIPF